MTLDRLAELAREGTLYPAVILHGDDLEGRRGAALELARCLLCAQPAAERPCGDSSCRHCSRLSIAGSGAAKPEAFHPDLHVLTRDLRTATSVDATRQMLRTASRAPFEARGQVFVIDEADSLSENAADALLKILEEPPTASPRHFFLLAPSRRDLSPTLRSRALSTFLGARGTLDASLVTQVASSFADAMQPFADGNSARSVLPAAAALEAAGNWRDPRARLPWSTAAAAVVEAAYRPATPEQLRHRLLAFASALLDAPNMRGRGISHLRLLEGLLSLHLFEPATRHRRWWSFAG